MTDKVLIVDDSLTVRMNLLEMLEMAGIPATAVASGAEARRALLDERFALVILDILLPDADGVDILKEIRETPSTKETAVMLLSTEAEIRDRIRGLKTGADEYIGKPYEPRYVVARAREFVGRGQAKAQRAQPTILIIDDSPTFRSALKEMLEQASFRVLTADTGEDGLQIAADMRPSALVVDGMLPGIDGSTVIRRIRLDAALRRTPCLLLTADEDRGAELRALDAGADAFVRKTEDVTVILAKLNAVLRSAGNNLGEQATASLLAPKKILAVDDSETYLQELAGVLRATGYEVVLARSGEDALSLLSVQSVDCILLDLMMPGIGGQETCRRIKVTPEWRDIPIVMLTALEDRNAMIQGFGAGADDFIAKSSDFEVLNARILAQIRRKQFEDEHRLIREKLMRKELEATEARAAQQIAEARAVHTEELEWKNQELEAFSYSVAHDLRAPLRSIDGFSQALLEDQWDRLDDEGREYLRYVRESAQQMAMLIDDLLSLSRVTRAEIQWEHVDLTAIASSVVARLRHRQPDRRVEVVIAEGLVAVGDATLLTVVFENILGNAWKFTGKRDPAQIEVGVVDNGQRTFFVRDNGAGFDMAYASKLFGVFQRLHSSNEFEGTGIGLAIVQRIIQRHGGKVRAEGVVGEGAAISFTLGTNLAHGAVGGVK